MANNDRLLKAGWLLRVSRVAGLAVTLAVVQSQLGVAEPSPNKGKPPSDKPVTTEFLSVDAGGFVCTISSDGPDVYTDNVDGVSSILTANTCNGLTWGDWRFSTVGPRSVTESFFSGDEVLSGQTGSQVPFVAANPPYSGSQLQQPIMNVQCTCTAHQNMYTMTKDQTFTCPLLNHWTDSAGNEWGVAPALSFTGFPETTDAQVTCNMVSGDHCIDWFIDPIGAPANEAVGRLNETPSCKHCSKINDGDFRMRFRIHVKLP